MDLEEIQKAYRRYAPHYDLYFGAVLQPGRRAVVERMHCLPGEAFSRSASAPDCRCRSIRATCA